MLTASNLAAIVTAFFGLVAHARLADLLPVALVASADFQLSPRNVYLECRVDKRGRQTNTGIGYVCFANPHIAEQARVSKDKQMMDTRYIECRHVSPGVLSL